MRERMREWMREWMREFMRGWKPIICCRNSWLYVTKKTFYTSFNFIFATKCDSQSPEKHLKNDKKEKHASWERREQ